MTARSSVQMPRARPNVTRSAGHQVHQREDHAGRREDGFRLLPRGGQRCSGEDAAEDDDPANGVFDDLPRSPLRVPRGTGDHRRANDGQWTDTCRRFGRALRPDQEVDPDRAREQPEREVDAVAAKAHTRPARTELRIRRCGARIAWEGWLNVTGAILPQPSRKPRRVGVSWRE